MRTIRQWLRNLLIWLPGEWGETVVLPRVRYAYSRLPFRDFRRRRYAASEAKRIRSAISGGVDRFTIVLDYKVAGNSYGDCLSTLGIARYVISKQCFVNFYLANTELLYHDRNAGLDDREKVSDFINDVTTIAKALLDPNLSSVCLISDEALYELVHRESNDFLLFKDFTINGRFFIGDCFNVLNNLMANSSESEQDQVLYSACEFKKHVPDTFSEKLYVSWGCRYSLNSMDYRYTTADEFLKIHAHLRARFPNRKILIVSDAPGCRYYSCLAESLQITDLLFSKDYSTEFLGDMALIMNSDFFFWFRAGGIDVIPRFSRLPYEMLGHNCHELMWDKKRLTSWQGDNQKNVNIGVLQPLDDRSADLERMGIDVGGI